MKLIDCITGKARQAARSRQAARRLLHLDIKIALNNIQQARRELRDIREKDTKSEIAKKTERAIDTILHGEDRLKDIIERHAGINGLDS